MRIRSEKDLKKSEAILNTLIKSTENFLVDVERDYDLKIISKKEYESKIDSWLYNPFYLDHPFL